MGKRFLLFLVCMIVSFAINVGQAYAQEKPEIFVQLGHSKSITAIAISPDGRYIASAESQVIKIWETDSGRLFRDKSVELEESKTSIFYRCLFTNDGKKLLCFIGGNESGLSFVVFDFIDDFVKTESIKWESILPFLEEYYAKKNLPKFYLEEDYELLRRFGPTMLGTGEKFYYIMSRLGFFLYDNISLNDLEFRIDYDKSFKEKVIKLYSNISDSTINKDKVIFAPDLRFALTIDNNKRTLHFYDLVFGKRKIIGESSIPIYQQWIIKGKFYDFLATCYYFDEKKRGFFIIWDIKNATLIGNNLDNKTAENYFSYAEKNKDGDYICTEYDQYSKDSKTLARVSYPNIILLDKKTNRELAKFIVFTDAEWIVITPEGYYNASPNGDKHLNVRIGNKVYGIENYREAFYRPDLVRLALSGGSLKDFKTLADIKQPPQVEIIDSPVNTEKEEIKITVRLTDQGGGIGDVRLYLNETAVLVDSTRGIKITPKQDEKGIYKTYTIKLLNGENIIKAVAFNGDNTMQSNPAVHKVMASLKIKKPSMYAIVIGINEYKNPKLELKYAVADAKLFAETLKQVSTPLFEKVEIKLLSTKEETTKENIKKSLEGMKNLSPEDVFVFYVASHGTVDEGEYFLITSNVGSLSTFRLKEDALTQTELKELIANVPSTKKFIVIDTCNAGKLGEALQVAMLTRGMSEETAMKILSKAMGSTILSASTSLQEALEGYQGHGLFTYVLTEGMKGKADTDRDGFIRTLELANYVDSEVPALAEKIFKRAQYPTATPSGQAFPIGKVK